MLCKFTSDLDSDLMRSRCHGDGGRRRSAPRALRSCVRALGLTAAFWLCGRTLYDYSDHCQAFRVRIVFQVVVFCWLILPHSFLLNALICPDFYKCGQRAIFTIFNLCPNVRLLLFSGGVLASAAFF